MGTLALLGILLATPLGSASHCNGTITTIPAGTETFYVDYRAANDIAIYIESNNQEFLQTGGYSPFGSPGIYYDPCEHAWPDTLLWSTTLII